MHTHERGALQRIAANLRTRFADRITAVYAFGSRVRGTQDVWSDFDLLVVVRDKGPGVEAEIVGMNVGRTSVVLHALSVGGPLPAKDIRALSSRLAARLADATVGI